MKSIFLIFLLAMFNHMDVMHKSLSSDLDTKKTSLHDPWLHLDTDNSQHKVWVHIFTSPDISLFHNPTMLNPESEMSKQKMFYIDSEDHTDDKEEDIESITEYKDIVSVTITYRLWHISDNIFKNLDAVSLLHCEKVCDLWKQYLIKERVWQKAVEKFANRYSAYVQQMGWWRHLPTFGGEQTLDLLVYRHTYWKMTNLNRNWSNTARSPAEQKKPFHHPPTSDFELLKSKFTNAQGKFQ